MAGAPDVLDAHGSGRLAVRGGAVRTAAFLSGVALSLLSIPLVVRHLGNEEWGVYVTITALVTIVAGLSDLGLTLVGVREWAAAPDARRRHALMADLLGARLVLAVAGAGLALAFALAAGWSRTEIAGTLVAALGLVLVGLQQTLTVPLAAGLRQGTIAAADLTRQVVQVAAILALVLAGAGLVPLLAATIPGALAALVVTLRAAPRAAIVPAVRPAAWRALLGDTLPFAAASAVSVVYLRSTVVLTSLVATAAETGWFGSAFRITEVLIAIPAMALGALFPVLARAAATNPVRLRRALRRTLRGALAAGAALALCVIVLAPLAIRVLTGERPHAAVDALRILGAGLGFSFLGAAGQFGLLAVRAHRAILVLTVGALALNIGLTLWLAGRHGAVGAAIALAASEALLACGALVVLRRVAPDR